jgi:hypothetical protein
MPTALIRAQNMPALSGHSPASTLMSWFHSPTCAPFSSTVCLIPIHLTCLPYMLVPCPTHTFFCPFPRPAKPPLFRAVQTSVLVSCWSAWWSCEIPAVSFSPTASQWELRMSTHLFPSCFPYNPKFLASRLLGLPLDFMLVSCSVYLTLKMETVCFSETSIDFYRLHGIISQKIVF